VGEKVRNMASIFDPRQLHGMLISKRSNTSLYEIYRRVESANDRSVSLVPKFDKGRS